MTIVELFERLDDAVNALERIALALELIAAVATHAEEPNATKAQA